MIEKDFNLKNYGLNCCYCGKLFLSKNKNEYNGKKYRLKKYGFKYYCSFECRQKGMGKEVVLPIHCTNCGKIFKPDKSKVKRNKTNNRFCSQSCANSYNNKHKSFGIRRSKLEIWIEKQLNVYYPTLKVLYGDKTTINSELDIFIPSLNLAFELNGICHYKPIYGEIKLEQIKRNDEKIKSVNI